MPAHPHHHQGNPAELAIPARLRNAMVGGIVVLAVLTFIGLIALWPRAGQLPDRQPLFAPGSQVLTGVVLGTAPQPSTEFPFGALLVRSSAGLELFVSASEEIPAAQVGVGARIRFVELGMGDSDGYFLLDLHRGQPLLVLTLLFVVVVLAVARTKGLAAIIGLMGGVLIVWLFAIPALSAGRNPIPVALVTASAVMFLVVYFAHGVSLKTTAALLSTLVSIGLVTVLGWLAMGAAHLRPELDGDMRYLAATLPYLNPQGILLCGMVLAGVGVLNDVTITQAATVWELRAARPDLTRREIARTTMRIGRDHIASSVYTIAFAYVGTSLAMLLLVNTLQQNAIDFFLLNEVAQELIATLVTSIGLVLAIPLSTIITAALIGNAANSGGLAGDS